MKKQHFLPEGGEEEAAARPAHWPQVQGCWGPQASKPGLHPQATDATRCTRKSGEGTLNSEGSGASAGMYPPTWKTVVSSSGNLYKFLVLEMGKEVHDQKSLNSGRLGKTLWIWGRKRGRGGQARARIPRAAGTPLAMGPECLWEHHKHLSTCQYSKHKNGSRSLIWQSGDWGSASWEEGRQGSG